MVTVRALALAAPPIAALVGVAALAHGSAPLWALALVLAAFGVAYQLTVRSQLDRSEERYSHLFRDAPVALWENDFSEVGLWLAALRERGVTDLRRYLTENHKALRDGISRVVVKDANQAAADLLGTGGPDELSGPFLVEVLDEESERLFLEQFCSIWDEAAGEDLEYTGLRLDGTRFRGILRWSNPAALGGDLSRMVTAVSDVTALRSAQQELEDSSTRNRAFLDALPDLMFVYGADRTILDYHVQDRVGTAQNACSRTDLYLPPDEFLGRRYTEVLPPRLAERLSIAIATTLETDRLQTLEYELPISGEERHWEMRITPIRNRPEVLALVRDVTDQVIARRELKKLVQAKDDFIATISHELRTPLTGIVGYAHLLQEDIAALPEDQRREMVETLVEQSADLSDIVEDLLVAAKNDLRRLHVARVPTNLRAQAAQILETWDAASTRQVRLVGSDVVCTADPARVRQIIRNLLTNAVRYGGPHITIEVAEGDAEGRVTVGDDGPGIPPDGVAEAFEPYRGLRPPDGLTASLGIGLPLSRNLARLMGGDLTYRHRDGLAQFELLLPLAASPPESEGTRAVSDATILDPIGST
jgi:signal transduction histidine kinase